MIFNNKNNRQIHPGSTQALEADHNDVVASMNSIILSFGLPKNAGVSCAFLLTEEVVPKFAKWRCEISVDKDETKGELYIE